jgi:hypothetical protein
VISTLTNVISTRRVWFLHLRVRFLHAECDFHMNECHYHTPKKNNCFISWQNYNFDNIILPQSASIEQLIFWVYAYWFWHALVRFIHSECYFHAECDIYTQSEISTRINVISTFMIVIFARNVIYIRIMCLRYSRVWFLHAECDINTHECDC